MLTIKLVSDSAELIGIRQLQLDNLKKFVSKDEAEKEGFVTAEYSINFLETMHNDGASVVAKDGDKVVGYALVTLKSIREKHELLGDLFDSIDAIVYNGILLKESEYVVVGQLCVAKNYRGKGLVQQMYQYFKSTQSHQFSYCITDVAQDNPRSLKAHLSSGFEIVETKTYGGISWDIVLWDWQKPC